MNNTNSNTSLKKSSSFQRNRSGSGNFSSNGNQSPQSTPKTLAWNGKITTCDKKRLKKLLEEEKGNQYEIIDISHNSIQNIDPLLEFIKTQKNLKELKLNGNHISSKDLKKLIEILNTHPSLSSLDLGFTQLKNDAIAAISESLMDHPLINKFGLDGNNLDDESTTPIAKMIENNFRIRTISLSNNSDISEAGIRKLFDSIKISKSIASIALDGNKKVTSQLVGRLLEMNRFLVELSLNNIEFTKNEVGWIAKVLENNHAITSLKLSTAKDKDYYQSIVEIIKRNVKERNECIDAIDKENWDEVRRLLALGVSILSVDDKTEKTIAQRLWEKGQADLIEQLIHSEQEVLTAIKTTKYERGPKAIYEPNKLPTENPTDISNAIFIGARDINRYDKYFDYQVSIVDSLSNFDEKTIKDKGKHFLLYQKGETWFIKGLNSEKTEINCELKKVLRSDNYEKVIQLLDPSKQTAPSDIISLLVKDLRTVKFVLNVSGKKIGDSGVIAIKAFLSKKNLTVEELDLSDTNLNDDGIATIADSLYTNEIDIRILKLNGNIIGLKAMQSICNILKFKCLNQLHIESCSFGDEEVKWIGSSILSNNSETVVHFARNKFSSEGAVALLEALEKVKLPKTSTKYRIGSCHHNNLGDIGMRMLIKIIEDESSRIPNYKIDCTSVGMTSSSARDLLSVLSFGNRKPLELKIDDNNLKDGDWLDYLNELLLTPVLHSLSISGNPIGNSGAVRLITGLRSSEIKSLRIHNIGINSELEPEFYRAVCKLSNDDDEGSNFIELNHLHIANNNISGDGFKFMIDAINGRHIQTLDISNITLSEQDLTNLCQVITSGGLQDILKLSLGHCNLDLLAIKELIQAMIGEKIGVERLAKLEKEALELKNTPFLQYLDLRSNQLDFPGLRSLLILVGPLENLKTIVINRNKLVKEHVDQLRTGTPVSAQTLQKLLNWNSNDFIPKLYLDEFEDYLAKKITYLEVETEIRWTDGEVTLLRGKRNKRISDLIESIKSAVNNSIRITSISMRSIKLDIEELEELVDFLVSPQYQPFLPTLKQFDISYNNELQGSGKSIARLVVQSELQMLILTKTMIDDDDAASVIEAIFVNSTVKKLKLKGNSLNPSILQLFKEEITRPNQNSLQYVSYGLDATKKLTHSASEKTNHLSYVFDDKVGNKGILKERFLRFIELVNDPLIKKPLLLLFNIGAYVNKEPYWVCGILNERTLLLVSIGGFLETELMKASPFYEVLTNLIEENHLNDVFLSVDNLEFDPKDHLLLVVEIVRNWSKDEEFLTQPLELDAEKKLKGAYSNYERIGLALVKKYFPPIIAKCANVKLTNEVKQEVISKISRNHVDLLTSESLASDYAKITSEQSMLDRSIYVKHDLNTFPEYNVLTKNSPNTSSKQIEAEILCLRRNNKFKEEMFVPLQCTFDGSTSFVGLFETLERCISKTDSSKIIYLSGENGSGKTHAIKSFISKVWSSYKTTDYSLIIYLTALQIEEAIALKIDPIEFYLQLLKIDLKFLNEFKQNYRWIVVIDNVLNDTQLFPLFSNWKFKLIVITKERNLNFQRDYTQQNDTHSHVLRLGSLTNMQIFEFINRYHQNRNFKFSLDILKGYISSFLGNKTNNTESSECLHSLFVIPGNLVLLLEIIAKILNQNQLSIENYLYGIEGYNYCLFETESVSSNVGAILNALKTNKVEIKNTLLENIPRQELLGDLFVQIMKKDLMEKQLDEEWNGIIARFKKFKKEIQMFQSQKAPQSTINNLLSRQREEEKNMEEYCKRAVNYRKYIDKLDEKLLSAEIINLFCKCKRLNVRIWTIQNSNLHPYFTPSYSIPSIPPIEFIKSESSFSIATLFQLSQEQYIQILCQFFQNYLRNEAEKVAEAWKVNLEEALNKIRKYSEDIARDMIFSKTKESANSKKEQNQALQTFPATFAREKYLEFISYQKWQYLASPLFRTSINKKPASEYLEFWHSIARDYFIASQIVNSIQLIKDYEFNIQWLDIDSLRNSLVNNINLRDYKHICQICAILYNNSDQKLTEETLTVAASYSNLNCFLKNLNYIFDSSITDNNLPSLKNISTASPVKEKEIDRSVFVTETKYYIRIIEYKGLRVITEGINKGDYTITEIESNKSRTVPIQYLKKLIEKNPPIGAALINKSDIDLLVDILKSKNATSSILRQVISCLKLKEEIRNLKEKFPHDILFADLPSEERNQTFLNSDLLATIAYLWSFFVSKFPEVSIKYNTLNNSGQSNVNCFTSAIHDLISSPTSFLLRSVVDAVISTIDLALKEKI